MLSLLLCRAWLLALSDQSPRSPAVCVGSGDFSYACLYFVEVESINWVGLTHCAAWGMIRHTSSRKAQLNYLNGRSKRVQCTHVPHFGSSFLCLCSYASTVPTLLSRIALIRALPHPNMTSHAHTRLRAPCIPKATLLPRHTPHTPPPYKTSRQRKRQKCTSHHPTSHTITLSHQERADEPPHLLDARGGEQNVGEGDEALVVLWCCVCVSWYVGGGGVC